MNKLPQNDEFIVAINDLLSDFFNKATNDTAPLGPSYRRLWEILYSVLKSGGKRLRPRITLLSYVAFSGKEWKRIVPVAAAQEILHFSLLIHDDIIDREFIRHGNLNVSGSYKNIYSKFIKSKSEQAHFANSAGLLAGDLIISCSYQLIIDSDLDVEEKYIALTMISKSIFEVAGGELMDTESGFMPYKNGDALKIARYKTASYSFVSPLITGSKLAGASDKQINILEDLGITLGIAYQLVDDLIGVFGNEESTGKSSVGDIYEGKRTFMVEQAMELMSNEDKIRFDTIFGNKTASKEDVEYIRKLFISTGAKSKTEETILEYALKSKKIVKLLDINDEYKQQFYDLIEKVTARSY